MRPLRAILLALLLLCAAATPALGSENATLDLLDQAERALAEADRAEATDEPAARALREQAVAIYRGLLADGEHENARMYRNLGTAYMRSGDIGRAVLAFRRADRLAPSDPLVRESLAAARAGVRTRVEPGRSAIDTLLWWRGRVPRSVLAGLGAAAWVTLWAALLARFFAPRGRYTAIALLCALVACVSIGSLGLERWLLDRNAGVVVVSDAVVARKGPSSDAYETAFEQPIRAGVEATLIEVRDGWSLIRLPSGRQAWLPAGAVEPI